MCEWKIKNEKQNWEEKYIFLKAAQENFNPSLLAISIDSYRLSWRIERYLQVAQPVEQVTAKDLSLLQLRWLCSRHKELDKAVDTMENYTEGQENLYKCKGVFYNYKNNGGAFGNPRLICHRFVWRRECSWWLISLMHTVWGAKFALHYKYEYWMTCEVSQLRKHDASRLSQQKGRKTHSKEIDEGGCCWQGRQHCNLEQIGKQIVSQLCHLLETRQTLVSEVVVLLLFFLSYPRWMSPQSLSLRVHFVSTWER